VERVTCVCVRAAPNDLRSLLGRRCQAPQECRIRNARPPCWVFPNSSIWCLLTPGRRSSRCDNRHRLHLPTPEDELRLSDPAPTECRSPLQEASQDTPIEVQETDWTNTSTEPTALNPEYRADGKTCVPTPPVLLMLFANRRVRRSLAARSRDGEREPESRHPRQLPGAALKVAQSKRAAGPELTTWLLLGRSSRHGRTHAAAADNCFRTNATAIAPKSETPGLIDAVKVGLATTFSG
jgi:hypothetical protein